MTWREAFLQQARSDLRMFDRLARLTDVEPCLQVHFFLMASEKLAKALLTAPVSKEPPKPTHAALVPMLQAIKKVPEIRRHLGFSSSAKRFNAYVNSLLELAQTDQDLAPEASASRRNAEYPWQDGGRGSVQVPAAAQFPEFDYARNPQMVKLDRLMRGLLGLYINA